MKAAIISRWIRSFTHLVLFFVLLVLSTFCIKSKAYAAPFFQYQKTLDSVISSSNVTNPTRITARDSSYATYSFATTFSLCGSVASNPTAANSYAHMSLELFGHNDAGSLGTYSTDVYKKTGHVFLQNLNGGSPTSRLSDAYMYADTNSSLSALSGYNLTDLEFCLSRTGSGTANISLDDLSVDYTPNAPTASLSSVAASSSAGFITFNISGDVTYTSANEQCDISLYQKQTGGTSTVQVDSLPFAHIIINSNPVATSTSYLGNQTWQGFGYSPTSTSWTANGIQAPFYSGSSVTIAQSYTCWHTATNTDGSKSNITDLSSQGLSPTLSNWNPSLNATPSALQNTTAPTLTACDTTGLFYWVCDFKVWLINSLEYLVIGNSAYQTLQFDTIRNNFTIHAPFAYLAAAFSLDFSNTATSEAIPTFTFYTAPINCTVCRGAITGVPAQTVSFNDSSDANGLHDFLHNTVRPVEVGILYVLFGISMIFGMPRRLFEKGGSASQ